MIRSMDKTGSDETAPGVVYDFHSHFLGDFVNEVLCSYPYEWGSISYRCAGSVEYSHSKLIGNIPGFWFSIPIHYIRCSGGWSNMDYYVY